MEGSSRGRSSHALPSTHVSVASYEDLPRAQDAVDLLSDSGFDVTDMRIVGHGMKSVEIIHGRMTNIRATLLGAMTGAWFGIFVGAMLGLFVEGQSWTQVVVTAMAVGAAFGSAFGLIGRIGTRGRRDFSSSQMLVASRYDVLVHESRSAEARNIISRGREA